MPLPPEAHDAQTAASRGRTSIGRGCGEASLEVHWLDAAASRQICQRHRSPKRRTQEPTKISKKGHFGLSFLAAMELIYIYIYKEELKTVVHQILACTQPNCHKTFTGSPIVECPQGDDVRKFASAEKRMAKNQKTTVRYFGFMEKVYELPCMVHTLLLWKCHAIVGMFFTVHHSSGSSPKAGCLC